MKWKSIVLHGLFWVATAWLITSGFSIERQEIEIINDTETIRTIRNSQLMVKILFCIWVSAIFSYLNIWNLRKLTSDNRRPFIIGRSFLLYVLCLAILIVSNRLSVFKEGPYLLPPSLLIGISLFYFTISIAYGLTRMWLQTENQRQQLQLEKRKAEISLLRNQLQPHFLFNALNNLLSMVDQQGSPRLTQSFEQLSQLLRFVIDETREDKVSIQKEIHFLKNYISLQLLRFETDEVNLNFNIIGEQNDQLVEPGLFISFVENAFKYGTEPERKTRIDLVFDLSEKNIITFSIENEVVEERHESEKKGTGIDAVRKRLELIYPNKHQLEIRENDGYQLTLRLETI